MAVAWSLLDIKLRRAACHQHVSGRSANKAHVLQTLTESGKKLTNWTFGVSQLAFRTVLRDGLLQKHGQPWEAEFAGSLLCAEPEAPLTRLTSSDRPPTTPPWPDPDTHHRSTARRHQLSSPSLGKTRLQSTPHRKSFIVWALRPSRLPFAARPLVRGYLSARPSTSPP
ncbi:uncharacterized protein B0I36DRAFT_157149 [Microdochium trichocladiopsis]|uniref:Uncharacterized protein n=1 Tax=Microdochium trichocladiopsis TaxID=1682393 RepID=A0A9P8Y0M9_9PEZI|nr:uncharacterized protein B0I36DRAFT_157149 [Microdochium trichocladiopsis]KAH7026345.1 hypothetical protein B0I36DRAFT_157149 [Microdochium trichocladiopsis]